MVSRSGTRSFQTGARIVLRSSTSVVLLLGALAAASTAALPPSVGRGEGLPPLPGPAPRARPAGHDEAGANARCASCHADIAAEWRGSLHQAAWTDPVFQQAYAVEPVAFCRGCHAPESDPADSPTAGAAEVGVACTTCHLQGGDVVGARSIPAADGGHAVRGDARMSTPLACASCHQFDFPRSKGQAMQDTISEHASSSFAEVSCQSCHMPLVEGSDGARHRSHDFSVVSDPDVLRRAVVVEAARVGSSSLELSLTAGQVGHAFPTGDMFRRLELRAEALDAEGRVVTRAAPIHLARIFRDRVTTPDGTEPRRVEVADTRVPPPGRGARVAALRFPTSVEGLSVRFTVAYQRMDHAMAASFGVEQARDEIVVASGLLPPPRKGTP